MTNQLDKAKKWENTLSSHLEKRHKSLTNLLSEIDQYKEEVFFLKYQPKEARNLVQGDEKTKEALEIIKGRVDEA